MNDNDFRLNQRVRTIVGTTIMLILAAIHVFRIGSYLNGNFYKYYYSYASDLMLPFAAYFLLSMNEIKWRFIRKTYVKVLIVFSVMTFSELMQLFGVYFFGLTFDMFDILMYAIGAIIAAFIDENIFKRFIPFWNYNAENR